MARSQINEIVTGKVYQRGNMLSWPREQKNRLMLERSVGVVVNLWTRLDPDMTDAPIDWYYYIPIGSDESMDPKILIACSAVVDYLEAYPDKSALILCEAGMTRSVFFAGIVTCLLAGLPGAEIYPALIEAVPNQRLKPYMIDYLKKFKV